MIRVVFDNGKIADLLNVEKMYEVDDDGNYISDTDKYIIENEETGYFRILNLNKDQADVINWFLENFCGSNTEDVTFSKLTDRDAEDI